MHTFSIENVYKKEALNAVKDIRDGAKKGPPHTACE